MFKTLSPTNIKLQSGAPPVTPLSPAAVGTPHSWWSFGNTDFLWQDAARTSPLTTIGQSIGAVDERISGVNHATAAGLNRPVWQGAALGGQFDGVDDFLSAAVGSIPYTADMTFMAQYQNLSGSAQYVLIGSQNGGGAGLTFERQVNLSGFGVAYVGVVTSISYSDDLGTGDTGALHAGTVAMSSLAGNVDGSGKRVFYDTATDECPLVRVATPAVAPISSGMAAYIGARNVGGADFFFTGYLRHLCIWSNALLKSEIMAVEAYLMANN